MTKPNFSEIIYFTPVEMAPKVGTSDAVFGEIDLPSGRIAAFDPLAPGAPVKPFAGSVAPGTYRIARFDQGSLVSILFSDTEAVRWEPAFFDEGAGSKLPDEECSGYVVNSGTGCFVDASAATSLEKVMKDSDWLYFGSFLEDCQHLFYVDLINPSFVAITSELLHVVMRLAEIAIENFPLAADSPERRFRQQGELRFLVGAIEKIQSNNASKWAKFEPLAAKRLELIAQLTAWIENNGFSDNMEVALTSWQIRPEHRSHDFGNFRIIVLPGDNIRAAVFSGFGDDTYPSFWGYDANGKVCQLLTDFGRHRYPNEFDQE